MTTLEAPEAVPTATTWQEVCRLDDLVQERGAAALLASPTGDAVQVALVRLLDDTVLAVSNLDPYTGANVMSRGLVGSRHVDGATVPTLTSPLHKQVFSLLTGACLDTAGKAPVPGQDGDLRRFPVRVVGGVVSVSLPGDAGSRP
ncbi:nitrite reductase (NAD(P)H) small subunit [Luteimicrobium sp. NPDC057192]|uniref:nitrite reductase (NAD(P)H) small subunit n=1 Tax=Luteimicrobium sp. NPDC057192 TaxID=3346042 RepID=UPI00363C273A